MFSSDSLQLRECRGKSIYDWVDKSPLWPVYPYTFRVDVLGNVVDSSLLHLMKATGVPATGVLIRFIITTNITT